MKELTKLAIVNTFIQLLQTQPIEKITVTTIAEKCGINRQTFYYHFSDIYELLEYMLNSELKDFSEIGCDSDDDDWRLALRKKFDYLQSHKRIILNAYNGQYRMYYEIFLCRQLSPVVEARFLSCEESARVPKEKLNFLVKVYTKILMALFIEWLDEGMPDVEKLGIEDYFTLLDSSFHTSLQRFQSE